MLDCNLPSATSGTSGLDKDDVAMFFLKIRHNVGSGIGRVPINNAQFSNMHIQVDGIESFS